MHLPPAAHARLSVTRLIRPSNRKPWPRLYTTRPANNPRKPDIQASPSATELPVDPRPKWMFSTAAFLRIVLVPAGLVYAVFYHDFGEEEHVFMPPRRWLQRQKESFFSLSPAEKDLVTDVQAVDERQQT